MQRVLCCVGDCAVLAWRVKRAVTLAANMAEVKSGVIPVPAKASTFDGLTDYLRQLEVAEDEVW